MNAYAQYKESGVQWIGKIPAHWKIGPAKQVSSIFVPQRNKPILNKRRGIPWITIEDISSSRIHQSTSGYCVLSQDASDAGSKSLPPKCVIASCIGNFGVASVNTVPIIINQQLQAYIPRKINPWFLRYFISISRSYFEKVATATTLPYVNREKFGDLPTIICPLPEQVAIATYLDRKTAQIDTLIAKKQRLIELLREERTAIISHTVTKGLDATVPLKDSGVEWIGEIPVHWKVVPLTKYMESIVDYRGRTPTKVTSGLFLVTARNIKGGIINYSLSQEYVDGEDAKQLLNRGKPKNGDVLFTTEAPLGEVANVDREDIALAQRVIKFRGQLNKVDNYYLKLWMSSSLFQNNLHSYATGSTAKGIKASKLVHLKLVLPKKAEQTAIAAYLDQKTTQIDALIAKTKKQIELLQEYRTTLISSVVTGKMDVRQEGVE